MQWFLIILWFTVPSRNKHREYKEETIVTLSVDKTKYVGVVTQGAQPLRKWFHYVSHLITRQEVRIIMLLLKEQFQISETYQMTNPVFLFYLLLLTNFFLNKSNFKGVVYLTRIKKFKTPPTNDSKTRRILKLLLGHLLLRKSSTI